MSPTTQRIATTRPKPAARVASSPCIAATVDSASVATGREPDAAEGIADADEGPEGAPEGGADGLPACVGAADGLLRATWIAGAGTDAGGTSGAGGSDESARVEVEVETEDGSRTSGSMRSVASLSSTNQW